VVLSLRAQDLPADPTSALRVLTIVAVARALGVNASDLVVTFDWQPEGTLVSVSLRAASGGFADALNAELMQAGLDRQTAAFGLGQAQIVGQVFRGATTAGETTRCQDAVRACLALPQTGHRTECFLHRGPRRQTLLT
jgi:hypothetical protein